MRGVFCTCLYDVGNVVCARKTTTGPALRHVHHTLHVKRCSDELRSLPGFLHTAATQRSKYLRAI
jgi:hypothetical protein